MEKFIILRKMMFGGWIFYKVDVTKEELIKFIQSPASGNLSEYKFIGGSVIEPQLSYVEVKLDIKEAVKKGEIETQKILKKHGEGKTGDITESTEGI